MSNARIETLLAEYATQFGTDAEPYGNHVRRVFGLVRAQGPHLSADQLDQVAIAAVFHDIAIWLDDTFDYLAPSRDHAADFLLQQGRTEWIPVVSRMVMEHHKLRPIRDDRLVEAFRRADLCDVSFGVVDRGIPAGAYSDLVDEYPVLGFQKRLVHFTGVQFRKDPRRPLPMLRW